MTLRLRLGAVYAVAAFVLLSACSGYAPNTQANSGFTSDVPKELRTASWMLPDVKKDALLYISTEGGNVFVYSYPANQLVGELNGFVSAEGLCSDKAGHVFVTDDFTNEVAEYAHGGTQPIAVFTQYGSDWAPISCAVDPGTDNLAVEPDGTHTLYVFQHESAKATIYTNPYGYGFLGGTYDGRGNFFMRGVGKHISELPKGSSAFINITLSRKIEYPQGFAWDGKYLSITNGTTSLISDFRIDVHGTAATIVSSSLLKGAKLVRQFTIYKKRFIAPDDFGSQVTFWKYPAFGNPLSMIQTLGGPIGSAISVGH